MPSNTLGHLFRVTTFGESHGEAVGAVMDGCPAGIHLDMAHIQAQMNRRKPGQSALTTERSEEDIPEFLSGIFEGRTTGAPISFIIRNNDSRSSDYDHLKDVFRPGHADFTYQEKYGHRDHRGGGRSSARTMAPWVCAGAIAQQILAQQGVSVRAWVSGVGPLSMDTPVENVDISHIDANAVRCPDKAMAEKMEQAILDAKASGDSLGGTITCLAIGVPVGWGEPQFGKLPAMLGHAMLSINAVKGFEMGEGFALSKMKGSEANDAFVPGDGKVSTSSNRSGGVLGGISNGMPVYFKVAFKPVSTIGKAQTTVNTSGEEISLEAKGRHDPCVVPRAVPIVEALCALVLADLYLQHRAYR